MTEDLLKRIYNACDPGKPATDENYLDCSEARGSTAFAIQYIRHLKQSDQPRVFLFSGHIGCGKSSELERLRRTLAKEPVSENRRYFPILINFSDYMDDYDFSTTEIVLTVVSETAAVFRERLGIELKDGYFTDRFNEIKDFLLSEVEDKEITVSLPFIKAKVVRLKADAPARAKVRDALQPKLTTMLEEINTFFRQARLELRQYAPTDGGPPFHDFVLILDDLEKVQGFEGKARGIESHRELFLQNAPRLRKMEAHVVYTVPLELVRVDGAQLLSRYDTQPFVLPMIKVIERVTRNPYAPGVRAIHGLLQKRFGDVPLKGGAFDEDALDFLTRYSGGHVKNLMFFIREACTYADAAPIPIKATRDAIRGTVRIFSTTIPEHHWQKLVTLDLSQDQKIPGGNDADCSAMLQNQTVLEYLNGGDDDTFADDEPWYAVNPIVRELQKFKSARDAQAKVWG